MDSIINAGIKLCATFVESFPAGIVHVMFLKLVVQVSWSMHNQGFR